MRKLSKNEISHEEIDGIAPVGGKIILVFIFCITVIYTLFTGNFWYSEQAVQSRVISENGYATCMHLKCVSDFKFERNVFKKSVVTANFIGGKRTFLIDASLPGSFELIEDKSVLRAYENQR